MIKRRELIVGVAALASPKIAFAQQRNRTYRVGILSPVPAGPAEPRRKALATVLASHGFIEGQNLVVLQRSPRSIPGQFDELAAELKAANVDVILTFGFPAALAAKSSARGVPVVITGAGDPVATGLVEGVARPGGDLTGVSELSTELSAKRLEILKDALPGLGRVAMLWNADDRGMTLRYRSAEDAARILGVKVQTLGVREPDDFDHAFSEMARQRPDALMMVSDALTGLNRKRVIDFAKANKLPTIFEFAPLVREGGLMSYGPRQSDVGERAAELVSRILRGARPADLPLELPTRFEFLINLKTASTLGLSLPPTLLARADEVIE